MSNYLVRASALQGYRETVTQLNGNPETILASAGLTGLDADPEAWIPYSAYLQLLENSAKILDCASFGLLLSKKQDINILGAVGFIIQQAPDIRTALRELSQYFGHHNQGATVTTTVEDGTTHWTFTSKPQQYAPMYQQSDLVAGIATKVMHLLYSQWKPTAIYLPHSAPANTRPYREVFDCPIYFDWDTTIVASKATILDTPLAEANPRLHSVLEAHLGELQRTFSDDFSAKVSYLIKQALLTGDCSVDRVASFLAMNKRTLQRKLSAIDTSYKDLLDEVRFEIACNYLRESTGPLTLLAHMLCYSELSVFSNAFRQRYGMSPREWKKQMSQAV
ncbi:MAG: AraC family transcriptional regulator [Halioglobus sp.]